MAKAQQPGKVSFRQRLKQIGMVFRFTAKRDKAFLPLAVVAALLPLIAAGVAVAVTGGWMWLAIGVMLAVLGVLIVLNLRANKAMLTEYEGQPGAAATILQSLRGDWRVRPAVASTTQFDMVHVVVGKPGVILIGEGHPQRVRSLMGQEKRRLVKVIGNAELREFVVGNGEGEVALGKLRMTLMKLPRTITAKDVNALDRRLTALSARPQLPKGAVPKNLRPPKGAFRAMRGR
jgi:hypothetical protein